MLSFVIPFRFYLIPRFEHCLVKNLRFCERKSEMQMNIEKSKTIIKGLEQDNKRMRELLDKKYTESIANLVTKTPTARYRFYIDIPSEENPETYGEFLCYRDAKARIGVGYVRL